MHINCRSIANSFDDILSLLLPVTNSLSILAVTETWLSDSTCSLYQLSNFNFIPQNRLTKGGGGIGLFINSRYKFSLCPDLCRNLPHLECLFIELSENGSSTTLIGCVYRPPNTDLLSFNADILDLLKDIDNKKFQSIAIAGDFNLDLIKSNTHSATGEFLHNLMSYSFLPAICIPTRITEFSTTLIDNIFVNNKNPVTNAIVIYSDISDHLPVAVRIITKLTNKVKIISTNKRVYLPEAIEAFNIDLATPLIWNDVYSSTDTNTAYESFHNTYLAFFDKHFPLNNAKISHKHSPRHEWMSKSLIKATNKKAKLYKKYVKSGKTTDKSTYTKYAHALKKLLKYAKNNHYANKFKAISGNLRKTWSLINTLICKTKNNDVIDGLKIKGTMSSDTKLITNTLNDYFINIGDTLASLIQPVSTTFDSYLTSTYVNSFALTPTDPGEIQKITNELASKTSNGHDGIPITIVKASIAKINTPLSFIINSSMANGCFPDLLKIAKICPIFKTGDKSDITNYRPISILTSISKIFEKVISNRLISYLDHYKIIHQAQYGFRKNHSTFMALLDLHNKITLAADNHEYAIGVFIDLSKAFDTINHSILLKKLYHYGIRGIALDLFSSYLSNRRQYVTLNGVNSTHKTIISGVPQGSVLGPLLFLLYINDIVTSSRLLHFILFADDTNLFYSCTNLDVLLLTVNNELSKLSMWFKANRLSLNISKTNFILFGSKRIPSDKPVIKIDDVLLTQVSCTKFLGVFVDAGTTWKNHVASVSTRISRGLGAINHVKRFLPQHILLLLYHTMVLPYLSYCCIVWGCASTTVLDKILVLQKRALRIISNAPHRTPSAPLFEKFNLLRINELFIFQTANFICKFKLNLLPFSCKQYFTYSNPVRPYFTRVTSIFVMPICRLEVRKNSISVRGPTLWNALPSTIQLSTSIVEFNRSMIKFLVTKRD